MDFNNTSDFIGGFWSLFIIVVTLASLVGCAVFLLIQDKAKTSANSTTGHVWDENLQEYNNPLPNWWRWLFYGTLVFALVYLVLFPGFGSYNGKLGWTMRGQYDQEMKMADQVYGPIFNKFLQMKDIRAVASDPQGREMGQHIYLTHCATCHGSDAKGTKGFPNLTDKVWLWGGTPEKIKESIAMGRVGIMTAKGVKPDLDGEQIKDVVAYVRSLAGMTSDSLRAQRGKEVYAVACAACHQADGKGLQAAGYPDLTVKDPASRLYGANEATMIDIVTHGRNNAMPAWKDILGDAKVHLVSAYIWSLGGGENPGNDLSAVLEGNTAKIYFGTGKADVTEQAQAIIGQLLALAQAKPDAKFAISGFHDASGDKAVNEELAKSRAKAVLAALVAAGIAETRVEMKKPAETQGTGDNKEARRVEATIL